MTCPLRKVRAGTCVRIQRLLGEPAQCQRLREMGFCEEQQIRLLLRNRSVVCQVCNVRFGLSAGLAASIWVEPLPPERRAAGTAWRGSPCPRRACRAGAPCICAQSSGDAASPP